MNIILASASPRRKEILENANVKFKIMASSIEELTLDSESPCQIVMRLAFEKGIDHKPDPRNVLRKDCRFCRAGDAPSESDHKP